MKRLYALCAVLAAALLALTLYYRAEPDTFYGIADTKEITLSSESGVEIKRIPVVQGQLVSQGDTLLELFNPELDLRLSQIRHEANELRARKAAHASLTKSEILQFKAQQEERVSEIRSEIKELEAQYDMNKQLVSELRSLDRDKAGAGSADAKNPILIKLESLRKLLELAQDPSRVYESRLTNALSSDGDPLTEQVSRLEDEVRILEEDRKRLVMTAQIPGLIGSVNFKVGEKVSPFAPILTLHAASPSFVRGYIHEDVYSQVAVKQKVRVQSNTDRRHKVDGEVVGVGARIVEYPERLRKRSDILIWGREIIIRIPEENRFLLGEKVLISLPGPVGLPGAREHGAVGGTNGSTAAVATDHGPSAPASSPSEIPRDIRGPAVALGGLAGAAKDVPGIEASGLVFLPDLGRFLVISDDTPKKRPLLYLLDTSFRVEKELAIRGLDKMDDMEAISEDGKGGLYVMSSQSLSKNGKRAEPRKLLAKVGRKGEALELEGKVVLLDALEALAKADAGKDWALFLKAGLDAGTTDIEGMAVQGGDLYLGFKAPLSGGKAVILRVAGAEAMVSGRVPPPSAVSIWKALDLMDTRTGTACGIADLAFRGEDAYFLSTGTASGTGPEDGRHAGELWALRKGAAAPVRLKDFGGAKPEGLALVSGSKRAFVAFDNGSSKPSQMLALEVAE